MAKIALTAENASFLLEWEEDGSGDYLVSVEAEAEGFRGHSDGHAVGTDVHRFIGDLERLERLRQGRAQISSAADGLFDVSIHAIDSAGHMGVSGILRYLRTGPERPYQVLEFFFEFDPSQLPKAVNSAHTV